MNSDSDSYFEENSSEDEDEFAGPLHVGLENNLEESPEPPPPGFLSPVLPPQPIAVGGLFPVWDLPDDGFNFVNFHTKADVLALKQGAQETRSGRNEKSNSVEEPVLAQNFVALLQ